MLEKVLTLHQTSSGTTPGRKEGLPLTVWGEWKSSLPTLSQHCRDEEAASLPGDRDESLNSLLGLLWHRPFRSFRVPYYSLERVQVEALHSAFAEWLGHVFFLWSLSTAVIVYSVLLGCSFHAPLTRESRLSLFYFLSVSYGISRLWVFLTSNVDYVGKKVQGTYHYIIPWLPRSLDVCFPSAFQSYLIFVIYNVQGFYFSLVGWIEKSMSITFSQKYPRSRTLS